MKINNWCKKLSATLAAAGMASAGSLVHADTSTTLTGLGATNTPIPAGHGSNAEVTLAWSPEWQQYADWNGRGDVYQIDQRITSLTFTPTSPTIQVKINSFEFDEWAGGGNTSADWSISGSTSGLFVSGTWTDKNTANDPTDAGGRTLITPNGLGLPGETLTLVFDHTASAGSISYLAMDNLVFSTTVIPEPSTAVMAWLGVGGLGALAMRRQRK
jgi:MYXO-CTERM domain-containing protein